MKNHILIYLFISVFSFTSFAQGPLKGIVNEIVEKDGEKYLSPLFNVNIYWEGTTIGTTTDDNGKFEILRPTLGSQNLIISYIGYKSDTIVIEPGRKKLDIVLTMNNTLKEVVIIERKKSTYVSKMKALNTVMIAGEELKKAACCNLSESFETNASVDVSYSDAVTGAKQIKLLGLAGKYSQIMTEKVPFIRGLSSTYGLGYIPGSWMDAIQVSKGAASVTSGYESITGQINVEYKKPDKGEWFYLNGLGSSMGKYEGNANARIQLNKKWSTMILLHGENSQTKNDMNGDSFLDMPLISQVNLLNRWKYLSEKIITQFGVKVLDESRIGGQIAYDKNKPNNEDNGYGVSIDSKYYEFFHKGGIIFNRVNTSLAIIHSLTLFDQNSVFGLKNYTGEQRSYNSNLMFSSFIGNTDHNYIMGISYLYDDYNESFGDTNFLRTEYVPGAYFEYTYAIPYRYTFMAGIRYDHHNMFGGFITPRAHVKLNMGKSTILRTSGGKGYRTPNLLAENSYLFASSRNIVVLEDIQQENAWNYGVSLQQTFKTPFRDIDVIAEFYRTDFINQLVVDMDQDLNNVYFYNLDGTSYSNSAQIEVILEPIKRLDVVMAYRITDVKATMADELRVKPLVNRYKGLLTLSYQTNLKKWQFDFTTQLNGDGRLPDTQSNPEEYRREDTYPAYVILNAQVTKYYRKWNVYFGSENITGFTQSDPIIAANDPFGTYFDSSMVWGPLAGRKFYLGFRYIID